MSDLRSVLAFFIGLVVFVLLVAFAVGKLIAPKKPATTAKAVTITVTPTKAVTPTPTGKPSFLSKIFGVFSRKPTLTPTPKVTAQASPTPTAIVVRVNEDGSMPELKAAINPDGSTKRVVYVKNNVQGVTTIPETGAPTLLLPATLLLGSAGMFLRRKK